MYQTRSDLLYYLVILDIMIFLFFTSAKLRHLTGYLWELFLGFVYVIQVTQMSILSPYDDVYNHCMPFDFHEKAYAQKYTETLTFCSCMCKDSCIL